MRALGLLVAVVLLCVSAPARSDTARLRASAHPCQAVRRRRARLPRVTLAERRQIVHRHARASAGEIRRWLALSPPPLVLRTGGVSTPFSVTPLDELEGTFDEAALAVVARALAYRDGATHPIHPRLVSLLYGAVQHFRVPYVNVVSGFRSNNPTSRHGQGRAVDFALPGVSDVRLAAWLRPRGFVGVGIYPTSGFVHLDVRARSYYWRDLSGPRERNRERRILAALGPRHDRDALARGVQPVPDLSVSDVESESAPEVEVPEVEIQLESDRDHALDAGVP
jgi:hypothetical protein